MTVHSHGKKVSQAQLQQRLLAGMKMEVVDGMVSGDHGMASHPKPNHPSGEKEMTGGVVMMNGEVGNLH
jgi:hypothetical protein